jgi:hypothetical protein
VRDWAAAKQAETWCGADAGARFSQGVPYDTVSIQEGCNGWDVVTLSLTRGADRLEYFYFDERSEQLIGVMLGEHGILSCSAGPQPTSVYAIACVDASHTKLCGPY